MQGHGGRTRPAGPVCRRQPRASLPTGSLKNDALGLVGAYWAKADANAAAQWALALPAGAAQRSAARGVTNHLVQVDPAQAAAFATCLPMGNTRNEMIALAAAAWGELDINGTIGWIRDLPDSNDRMAALSRAGLQWMRADPSGAMAYLQTFPDGYRTGLLGRIAGQWGATDPATAVDWIQSLPPGADRDRLFIQWLPAGPPTCRRKPPVPWPACHPATPNNGLHRGARPMGQHRSRGRGRMGPGVSRRHHPRYRHRASRPHLGNSRPRRRRGVDQHSARWSRARPGRAQFCRRHRPEFPRRRHHLDRSVTDPALRLSQTVSIAKTWLTVDNLPPPRGLPLRISR